jgi:hypothetical protein
VQPEHCVIDHTNERRANPKPLPKAALVGLNASSALDGEETEGLTKAAVGAAVGFGGKVFRRQSSDDSHHGRFAGSLRSSVSSPGKSPPSVPSDNEEAAALPASGEVGSLMLRVLNRQAPTYRNGKHVQPEDGQVG